MKIIGFELTSESALRQYEPYYEVLCPDRELGMLAMGHLLIQHWIFGEVVVGHSLNPRLLPI